MKTYELFDLKVPVYTISFSGERVGIGSPNLEITDGYHTFNELYQHRYTLFCALVKIYDNYITPLGCKVKCFKSKLHSDGTMFDNSFIVMMTFPDWESNKQISYHLPIEWWDKFNIVELDRMIPWDGHDSNNVLERLMMM